MDGQRFDAMTRVLGAGSTRRGALGLLAGLLALPAAAPAAAVAKKGKQAKKAGKVGVCHRTRSATNPVVFIRVSANAAKAHEAHGDAVDVDLQTDPENCGACGNVCEDDNLCTEDQCIDGECAFAIRRCPVGTTCCPETGECTDLGADEANCGACGNACAQGQTCEDGECVDVLGTCRRIPGSGGECGCFVDGQQCQTAPTECPSIGGPGQPGQCAAQSCRCR